MPELALPRAAGIQAVTGIVVLLITGAVVAGLFAVFARVNISNPKAPGGTGLGLHLSQQLAQVLGSRIAFTSEYGKGSTFTFVVPEQ